MNKDFFDKDKYEYENIEIPEELDFVVRKTLKQAKKRKNKKNIYKPLVVVAATIVIFIVSVNVSPTIANAISNIPGLSKLVELVKLDRGFDNAVDEGLSQDINWRGQENGINLTVTTIVGDWKNLWVGYTIKDHDKYEITMEVLDSNGKDSVEYLSGLGFYPNQPNDNYTTINFLEYKDEFILRYKVFKTRYDGTRTKVTEANKEVIINNKKPEPLAVFDVPINLDESIFNSPLRNVELTNNTLETNVGTIKFSKLETSKTRVGLNFTLESDKYDFMSFDNPRLVDDKGNSYEIPNAYTSNSKEENEHRIEFKGEIKDSVKTLEFKCDGVYYAPKNKKSITINLKNKLVEPNDYGFKLESLNGDYLTITSEAVKGVTFDKLLDENGEEIVSSRGVEQRTGEVRAEFKVNKLDIEKIELPIYWIMKDKIDGVTLKLIER